MSTAEQVQLQSKTAGLSVDGLDRLFCNACATKNKVVESNGITAVKFDATKAIQGRDQHRCCRCGINIHQAMVKATKAP
jgi:hypothetical protein